MSTAAKLRAAAPLRPVEHESELSVVEHLTELRWRIATSIVALGLAFAGALWQNGRILDIANRPLPSNTVPSTFGVGEAFTSTLSVSLYAALILSAPVLIFNVYAFVLPAWSREERRQIAGYLVMAPVLFVGGVVFAYFMVIPAAADFLLNFNDEQFAIQVRAREYYSFFGLSLLSIGALFEFPIALLAAMKMGVVTPSQLRRNRRYALLAIAVVAMILPGTDPVTMVIAMVPLVILFEATLWLGVLTARRRA